MHRSTRCGRRGAPPSDTVAAPLTRDRCSLPPPSTALKSAPVPAHRGRLFRKYLLLILAPVTVILLASGWISFDFSSTEIKSGIAALQHEKAVAAASRIEQYIRQISQQLAYASLPQVDANDVELRRIEFLKLLRQAPEVTDIAQTRRGGTRDDRGLAPRNGSNRLGQGSLAGARVSQRAEADSPGMGRSISARRPSPT